ncbi:MAG TPA: winged helix-turn-helix domain-containing protein [Candidatus Sulfotelmatobacter sp.]|nr:winged helix-turn-helix domain-containing protein [Candidatus Sulfotelmatobacter sp.]
MTPNNLPRSVWFGPYEADFHTQELRKHGMKLKLSGQPLQILEMLLARSGELVTREELQKQLWADDVNVDSNHGLNAAVNKLRDALGDSAEDPKYIETLPRRGYRFIGTIQSESQPVRAPAIPLLAPVPISSGDTKAKELPAPDSPQPIAVAPAATLRRRSRIGRPVFFASAAMLLLGIGVTVFLSRNQEMAENILRMVRKDVAENLAAAARSSRPQPDAHSLVGADQSDAKVELHGTAIPRIRTVSQQKSLSPMLRTVIDDDSGNAGPQFSPDGKRIAYMSSRTGPWQIWVSNTDGSNPRQVSFTESAGTPRWSPDGRSIAFDAPYERETRIFVVKVDGNEQARPIVQGLVPSFSRDGKWIYFASDQTGDWQVWKVRVSGGGEVQVTTGGGFAALESADGYIYYSKSRYPQPEICRVPLHGGTESCVLQHLRPRTWASWAVTQAGIVFVEDMPNEGPKLSLYDPAKRQVHDLLSLQSAPFWMGASADGKRAIMNDAEERQISMVDHLR